MKIILLASNPKLYSNSRIIEAARNRGHNIIFANVRKCFAKVAARNCEIYGSGKEKLTDADCVITRIKPSITSYGAAIIRQFELLKIPCYNSSKAILQSRDKFHALQILASSDIDIPVSSFANSSQDTKNLIKLVDGVPLVVKILEGTKGVGVLLAESVHAAESLVNAFRSVRADILVQNYVKESKGSDIRCFVIGGKVIAAIQRVAQDGEFRANIHLGASAQKLEITEKERQMAIKAATIMGLEIAGVDFVRSKTGPKILEVNSSPGLEGIELTTKIDIADQIIQHLETLNTQRSWQ